MSLLSKTESDLPVSTSMIAPDDYIFQTLKRGRIGTPMQPFLGTRGLANPSNQDAYDIIAHLWYLGETYPERMKNQVAGPGNPTVGEVHFNINCSACHQVGGKVGFAPAIRNPDFLAIASDDFIRETIHEGGGDGHGGLAGSVEAAGQRHYRLPAGIAYARCSGNHGGTQPQI